MWTFLWSLRALALGICCRAGGLPILHFQSFAVKRVCSPARLPHQSFPRLVCEKSRSICHIDLQEGSYSPQLLCCVEQLPARSCHSSATTRDAQSLNSTALRRKKVAANEKSSAPRGSRASSLGVVAPTAAEPKTSRTSCTHRWSHRRRCCAWGVAKGPGHTLHKTNMKPDKGPLKEDSDL